MVDLSSFRVKLPYGRSLTMEALVSGWVAHVERLRAEAEGSDEKDAWGAHDLVAALTLRDFIAQGLDESGAEVTAAVESLVEPADVAFREFTVPDPGGGLRAFGAQPERDERWWWDRVPAKGPARVDLMRWIEGSQNST